MPAKLKDLEITKVDFVLAGANPEAHILLYKNKSGAPDPPSDPEGGEVKQSLLRKTLSSIGSLFGLKDDQIDAAIQDIAKADAATFGEKMDQVQLRRVLDEIWDVCYALSDSLCSIMQDAEVIDKGQMMQQSLTQFTSTVQGLVPDWSNGNPGDIAKSSSELTPDRLAHIIYTRDALDAMIDKATDSAPKPDSNEATAQKETQPSAPMKGESDMKFDKSKMSAAEVAALEELEKKYGLPEESTQPAADPQPTPKAPPALPSVTAADDGDIYKGLHPAVRLELEALKKMADAVQERELKEVAKKYEILGRKPEELVATLKAVKVAGGNAYDEMIATLDAGVAAIEKSGIFGEIGKSGQGDSADAWTQIEKHAETLIQSTPTLTYAQAINKACEQHPELVQEYEKSR